MVAAQLILINHFLMTLTKNTVDMPELSSKNSVGGGSASGSACPYGCTQCSAVNGCLACKPPYYLLLLREGPMQTAHCTKTCPKAFYRINRKKHGFCSKCRMRGCLECLSAHYCTLCEDGFRHHHGRCYSQNDTDDMNREMILEREERILNNVTMTTTPTTSESVSFTPDLLFSTKSISQLSRSETTSSNLPESSTISTHLNPITPFDKIVIPVTTQFIEKASIVTVTENSSIILPTSSTKSTNKRCRKRSKSKRKSRKKEKSVANVNITNKESNKRRHHSISKEKKEKKRKRQRGRHCDGQKQRRKQKKNVDHSAEVNNKNPKTTNILLSKHRNYWKSHRIRHHPRHKKLKRLLKQRHLLEEAQKTLQRQRAEQDNNHKSASAASIAKKIRELRQMTLSERAWRKKHKLLGLYQQNRQRPDDSTYYGPGSIFDGLM